MLVRKFTRAIEKVETFLDDFGTNQDVAKAARTLQFALVKQLNVELQNLQYVRGDLDANEYAALVHNGNKIQAIKLYRERANVGLKEAKDFIEAQMEKLNLVYDTFLGRVITKKA